ncbi:hypothetical protein JCM15457_217 [Liquorilactobacillus sucicola DSM 21376 = JCM 15457]|nr:hypothetical protein JCM15457_217 [Liquorilactobacillus sucicola DSM 21376 = JCM 15457]
MSLFSFGVADTVYIVAVADRCTTKQTSTNVLLGIHPFLLCVLSVLEPSVAAKKD